MSESGRRGDRADGEGDGEAVSGRVDDFDPYAHPPLPFSLRPISFSRLLPSVGGRSGRLACLLLPPFNSTAVHCRSCFLFCLTPATRAGVLAITTARCQKARRGRCEGKAATPRGTPGVVVWRLTFGG